MTDQKKEKNEAAEEKLAKVLKDALAEEIGEIPEASIRVEELKALEAADRKKRANKKRLRLASIAAVAVIVCVAAVYMAWPKAAVPVDADKNTQQRVEEKDGMVIINEGDGNGEAGVTTWSETNWDNVEEIRKYIPNILIPEYIPAKYQFIKASLEIYSDDERLYECIYNFKYGNLALNITIASTGDSGSNTGFIKNAEDKKICNLGTIYLIKEKNGLTGILFFKNTRISIFGKISEDELVKIYESLK